MCVCCTHLFSFFPLAVVLVNDLFSGFSLFLFWKCVRFCFCCCLFLFVVCTCILCLLPCLTRCSFIDVLSCTPTGVSEINYLTCSHGSELGHLQSGPMWTETAETTISEDHITLDLLLYLNNWIKFLLSIVRHIR